MANILGYLQHCIHFFRWLALFLTHCFYSFGFFLCSGVTPHNADRERRGPQIPDILLKAVHVHVHYVAATAVTLSGSTIKMIREVLLHSLTLYSNHQHHPSWPELATWLSPHPSLCAPSLWSNSNLSPAMTDRIYSPPPPFIHVLL